MLQMPPTLRDVARLTFLERCDRAEMCSRLGISAATGRKRFQRMRESLQSLSMNHGAWSPAHSADASCIHA